MLYGLYDDIIITIFYRLAAHLPIYYFYNLPVIQAINSILLCWCVAQSPPPFSSFLQRSDLGSSPLSALFFFFPVVPMEDCSCGCLARMVPIADACVYESSLELTESQRRGQLSLLLYNNHGFRAPYVCRLTTGDSEESWVCVCYLFCFLLCRSHF